VALTFSENWTGPFPSFDLLPSDFSLINTARNVKAVPVTKLTSDELDGFEEYTHDSGNPLDVVDTEEQN
jgi:hypothetical protein